MKGCLIESTAVKLPINPKLRNICRLYTIATHKMRAKPKPYDYVKLPRVSRYGLKHFHWNSADLIHDTPQEKNLALTHDVYYHTLNQGAGKYRSLYDKTAQRCGPFLLQGNAGKPSTNQAFFCFGLWNFSATNFKSFGMASNIFLLRFLLHFVD